MKYTLFAIFLFVFIHSAFSHDIVARNYRGIFKKDLEWVEFNSNKPVLLVDVSQSPEWPKVVRSQQTCLHYRKGSTYQPRAQLWSKKIENVKDLESVQISHFNRVLNKTETLPLAVYLKNRFPGQTFENPFPFYVFAYSYLNCEYPNKAITLVDRLKNLFGLDRSKPEFEEEFQKEFQSILEFAGDQSRDQLQSPQRPARPIEIPPSRFFNNIINIFKFYSEQILAMKPTDPLDGSFDNLYQKRFHDSKTLNYFPFSTHFETFSFSDHVQRASQDGFVFKKDAKYSQITWESLQALNSLENRAEIARKLDTELFRQATIQFSLRGIDPRVRLNSYMTWVPKKGPNTLEMDWKIFDYSNPARNTLIMMPVTFEDSEKLVPYLSKLLALLPNAENFEDQIARFFYYLAHFNLYASENRVISERFLQSLYFLQGCRIQLRTWKWSEEVQPNAKQLTPYQAAVSTPTEGVFKDELKSQIFFSGPCDVRRVTRSTVQ